MLSWRVLGSFAEGVVEASGKTQNCIAMVWQETLPLSLGDTCMILHPHYAGFVFAQKGPIVWPGFFSTDLQSESEDF